MLDKEKIEAEMFKIIKSNKDFMETPYLYGLKALTETTKILNGYVNDLTNFIDNPKLLYEAKNVLNEYTEFFPKYIEEIKIWNIELKNSFEKMKNKIEGFLKASNKIFPEYHEFRDWYITHCYFNLFLNKKEFFKRGILPNDFQLFHEAYSKMIEGRSFGEAITGLEVVIINNMVEFKQIESRILNPNKRKIVITYPAIALFCLLINEAIEKQGERTQDEFISWVCKKYGLDFNIKIRQYFGKRKNDFSKKAKQIVEELIFPNIPESELRQIKELKNLYG